MLSSLIYFGFFFKRGFLLKKMDPICKGLHWFCCSLRLMIKFWNHNITESFPSNQLGAKLLHILQNVICAVKPSRSQQQLCTCKSKALGLCKPAVLCRACPPALLCRWATRAGAPSCELMKNVHHDPRQNKFTWCDFTSFSQTNFSKFTSISVSGDEFYTQNLSNRCIVSMTCRFHEFI